ncbi:ribonuclease H-like domain-containing protein [Tanacetum coccineum]|uniref:Ribonuclease H-like domain-containing protein n=1 Tax=Tanacetum coccineum TaxID=301880 RepID=A0ABQ5IZD8_9ASTR
MGVTVDLFNNLDGGNPMFLQPNDTSSISIVNFKLIGAGNYKMWAIAMKWKLLMSVPSTSGSLSAFYTNEQMLKLLSLINEKPSPSANMSGHPSGTLAKITAIGSLRSTSGIVLFDVLLVLEYHVSLVSMNKIIKDSKFFVGFDAHKCYILDLKLVEDEVDVIATQIGDSDTFEGNVQNSLNGKDPFNVLETSPMLRRSSRQRSLPFSITQNTYELANLPPGRKAIGCKWIWKIKYNSYGEVARYKDRFFIEGYNQRKGIDYEETFSHLVKIVIVTCLTALSVKNNWPLYQLDVNSAFLYGDLNEEVYMEFPLGYF